MRSLIIQRDHMMDGWGWGMGIGWLISLAILILIVIFIWRLLQGRGS